MKITIYGSKGTMPFYNENRRRRGSNTACVRLDTEHGIIVLDCGSGIWQLASDLAAENTGGAHKPLKMDVLISHLHLDHIIGLCVFKPMWESGNDIRLYTKSRGDSPLSSQVFGVFKPPYWPVDLASMFKGTLVEIDNDSSFTLNGGHTRVQTLAAAHQDDTTAFRIEAEKTVVYLLDYEADENTANFSRLARFCAGSDVVIFDTCYLPKDIEAKRGWGHSTFESGVRLAQMCGCKQMVFAHFSFEYSDADIDQIEPLVRDCGGKYIIAYDGMEMTL